MTQPGFSCGLRTASLCLHVHLWPEEEGLGRGFGMRTEPEGRGAGGGEGFVARGPEILRKWLRAPAEGEEPWGEGWIRGWRELEEGGV